MQKYQSPLNKKVLVSYLYFIQGIFLQIPATTILTYKTIPSYGILGLFSFAVIPFSLKFISAPFIQKYTSISYGRRKTWVVISFLGASLSLFMSTYFTGQSQSDQQILAMFLTCVIFMVSLQDISTDALAVKQLDNAQLASYLQCVMQSIGGVVGGILYLQLVSGSLYKMVGLTDPFLTTSQFFCCISGLVLVSTFIIHIYYKQKLIQQQINNKHTFWQVILHYRYFIIPKYTLCRKGMMFILYMHGLNYFLSSYLIQLIKNNHISKDYLQFLSNIMIIPILVLLSILKKYSINKDKNPQKIRLLITIRFILVLIFFICQIQSRQLITIFFIALTLLAYAQFFINSITINSVADAEYSGMFVTMMASLCNFGNNTTIQLKVIDAVGYRSAAIFGFIYTGVFIGVAGKFNKWVQNGIKKEDQKATQGHQKDA